VDHLDDAPAGVAREHVAPRRLEQLPTPLVCAAQRLADGVVIGFNRGDVGLAVQAAARTVTSSRRWVPPCWMAWALTVKAFIPTANIFSPGVSKNAKNY